MDPTPDEIKRICKEEIQSKWSEKKRKTRTVGPGRVEWKLPVVKLSDLPDEIRRMLDSVDKENER